MLLHHRDQHFLGQAQIILSEAAADGGGLLHQVGDLVQQAGIIGNRAADFGRESRHLRLDRGLSRVPIDDDVVGGDQRQ